MMELIDSLSDDFESLDNFELYSRTFIHYHDEFCYKNGGNKKVDTNYSILTPSIDVINKMPFVERDEETSLLTLIWRDKVFK